jgi:hypothetical protein
MTWLIWGVIAAVAATVLRQLWAGIGPPWRWPALAARATRRRLSAPRRALGARWRRRRGITGPDPFELLQMQQRLGALADELRLLESEDADSVYWARAHRIHSRRCAYDQLLTRACALAGVPGPRTPVRAAPAGAAAREIAADVAGTGRLTEEERFRDEIELASRGWSW